MPNHRSSACVVQHLKLAFKGGRCVNLLLGEPVPASDKFFFSTHKYEQVASDLFHYVTSSTSIQKQLKRENSRRSKRQVESNKRALFLKQSVQKAISSLENGEAIANEFGIDMNNFDDGQNNEEMDEGNGEDASFLYAGLASQQEVRDSFVDQRQQDQSFLARGSKMRKYEPIQNKEQLSIVRNKKLAFGAMAAVARYLDAVPPQEDTGAYLTATLIMISNVDETKSSGGRPKKNGVSTIKPKLTIVSHNRTERQRCYEALFSQGQDGAQEYDITNIQLDDDNADDDNADDGIGNGGSDSENDDGNDNGKDDGILYRKVQSLENEFHATRKKPSRKSREVHAVVERTEVISYQTPKRPRQVMYNESDAGSNETDTTAASSIDNSRLSQL